jgi:hypothetical protein
MKNLSLLLILLAFTTFPSLAHAVHSWGGYHWARTTVQFTLKLGNNLTNDWLPYLQEASLDWNTPGGLSTTPVLTAIVGGSSGRWLCKGVAGTAQVCNFRYGKNGWLGLATINITGGTHITQGTIKMNDSYFKDSYFNTSLYNNPNEKLHVMCQEVAHAFGLDHQSTDGSSQNSCMDYFSNTGANATSIGSTEPNAHDFEELNILYAHFDSTTTVAAMTALAASASEVTNDPNSWGQLMSQSANGRSSAYERFHADGSQTITHVYWTIEAAANCPACDHRHDH